MGNTKNTRTSNAELQAKYGAHANGLERTVYLTYLLGQNIIYIIAMIGLQAFWQFTLLVPIGAIGIIFLVARLWDAINDPILGGIVQRTNPKKGKFKPWTFVVAFMLPIATMVMFVNINPTGSTSTGIVIAYAAITYIIWGMVYTLCDVPIFSLAMTMEPDTKKRSSLIMLGRVGSGIAGIFVSFIFFGLSGALNSIYGGADGAWAWSQTISAAILLIIALLTMVPIFIAKERNIPEETTEVPTLKSMFTFIKSNDHLLKLLLTVAIVLTLSGVFMATLPTYVYSGGFTAAKPEAWLTILMTLGGVVGLLNTFAIMFLIPIIGKRKSLSLFFFIGIVATVLSLLFAVVTDYAMWSLIFYVIGGYCIMMAPIITLGLFTSECIEYGHYKTGIRQEAVGFSTQTFLAKAVGALGAFLASIVMLIAGVATITDGTSQAVIDAQPHAAQVTFWISSILIIAAGVIGILMFTFFYNLKGSDAAKYAEINISKNARFEKALNETPEEFKKAEAERKKQKQKESDK